MADSEVYPTRGPRRETVLRIGFEGFMQEFTEKHAGPPPIQLLWEGFEAGAAVQLALCADAVSRDG